MFSLLFNKFKKPLEKCIDVIGVVFFSVVFIFALSQIFFRWVIGRPITWSEELIRMLYVWICYIGWTIASRNRTHIRITFLIDMLPPVFGKIMETINCLLVILFSALMVYWGIRMTYISSFGRAIIIPISFAVVYIIAPTTNFIILLYQLADIASIWKKPAKSNPVPEERK